VARVTKTCHRPFRGQAGGFDCQGNRSLRWPRSISGGRRTNALTQQEADALIHQKRRKRGHSDFLRGIEKSGVFFPHQYTDPVQPPAISLSSRIDQGKQGCSASEDRTGWNEGKGLIHPLFRPRFLTTQDSPVSGRPITSSRLKPLCSIKS